MDEFGFRILDNHLKEFAIPITPESFRRLLKRDKHEEMLYDLMKKAGITCSLVCLSVRWRVSERSQTQPLARAFLKCKIPSCTSKFVGQLNEQPVKEAMPMKFCRIGKISHASDDTEGNGELTNEVDPVNCEICNARVRRKHLKLHKLHYCSKNRREIETVSWHGFSRIIAPQCLLCFQQYKKTDAQGHIIQCKYVNGRNMKLSPRHFENEFVFPIDPIKKVIVCPQCDTEFEKLYNFHIHFIVVHNGHWMTQFPTLLEYKEWFKTSGFASSFKVNYYNDDRADYVCEFNRVHKCKAYLQANFILGGCVTVIYSNIHSHMERKTPKIPKTYRSYISRLFREGYSDQDVLTMTRDFFKDGEVQSIGLETIKRLRSSFAVTPQMESAMNIDNVFVKDPAAVSRNKHRNVMHQTLESSTYDSDIYDNTQDPHDNACLQIELSADEETTEITKPESHTGKMSLTEPRKKRRKVVQDNPHDNACIQIELNDDEETTRAAKPESDATGMSLMDTMELPSISSMSAKQYFRDILFHTLLKAFDDPETTEHQWQDINDEISKILKDNV